LYLPADIFLCTEDDDSKSSSSKKKRKQDVIILDDDDEDNLAAPPPVSSSPSNTSTSRAASVPKVLSNNNTPVPPANAHTENTATISHSKKDHTASNPLPSSDAPGPQTMEVGITTGGAAVSTENMDIDTGTVTGVLAVATTNHVTVDTNKTATEAGDAVPPRLRSRRGVCVTYLFSWFFANIYAVFIG
jgi:hypothetical protein